MFGFKKEKVEAKPAPVSNYENDAFNALDRAVARRKADLKKFLIDQEREENAEILRYANGEIGFTNLSISAQSKIEREIDLRKMASELEDF